MKKKISLPIQILIALVLGVIVGLICFFTGTADFTTNYLKPFGTIFINLLKFLVVPVVLFSMIDGIISMGDMKKVGSVGWKTVAFFLCTTALACVIGLVIGSEGDGVSRLVKENCDFTASIPMYGKISSLNASVAAALLMYEVVRQRNYSK